MLKWFVEGKVMTAAIKGNGKYLIEEDDVETRPERVLMQSLVKMWICTSCEFFFLTMPG